jgi:hypothetical protein
VLQLPESAKSLGGICLSDQQTSFIGKAGE